MINHSGRHINYSFSKQHIFLYSILIPNYSIYVNVVWRFGNGYLRIIVEKKIINSIEIKDMLYFFLSHQVIYL